MRSSNRPPFAAATLAMAAVVLASNILVQFPINNWLTWGAITYPVAFLVSELVNRAHGPQQARRVAWVGFAVAVAASLVILVGSVAKSKRFMRQLEDAVKSIHVAHPQDPMAQMGPVIEAPQGKLLEGLTSLERGESWLLEPKKLDDSGKLWSPGIRTGVRPGSKSHKTEFFGPMLSVMTARSLEDALALQNAVEYGLTAGLHSLDPNEINLWISKVQAGNLYVNRTITGAIVQRQPFGGWKRSSIGPTAKAGGPNYLATLSDFGTKAATLREVIKDKQLLQILAIAAESELTDSEVESLTRGLQNDIAAKRDYFAKQNDPSGLSRCS